MERSTHVSLLARLADGDDPAAWWEFHDRYRELLLGFARRCGLQPIDCDDVAQEVLLNLTRSMPGFRYDPTRGKFRSYLKTAVVHAVSRHSSRSLREEVLDGAEVDEHASRTDSGLEALWEEEWRRHHVRHAMCRLASEFNETDRMAFTDYALRDRAAAETARLLGVSVDRVYQAKSRILRRLGELIAGQVSDEG
jgi:RNA polymerase sigma-70 factor (ECF subfamily)